MRKEGNVTWGRDRITDFLFLALIFHLSISLPLTLSTYSYIGLHTFRNIVNICLKKKNVCFTGRDGKKMYTMTHTLPVMRSSCWF